MFQKRGIDRNIDWITLSLYLALVMLGWMVVYAVEYQDGQESFLRLNSPAGKQMIWSGISFAAFFIITLIDYKFWQTFAYPIYGVTILLLIGVLIIGIEIKGARSWYAFAGFRFQPSELAKFGTCLAMAAYLSTVGNSLKQFNHQLVAAGLLVAPFILIGLQPDMGSALVFLSFLIVLYREGLPSIYYIIGGTLALLLIMGLMADDPKYIWIFLEGIGVVWLSSYVFKQQSLYTGLSAVVSFGFFWGARQAYFEPQVSLLTLGLVFLILSLIYIRKRTVQFPALLATALFICGAVAYGANYAFNDMLKPHQQDRINVWLQPEKCDPRGSLYNLIQSKMAISAGGATGKGFLNGTITQLNYVPEQSTDFIFTTIGEEQGFLGVVLVIGLFLAFLIQIIRIAERQRSAFSRIYAYGFAGIVFIHVFINIGMTMGLAPVIGIPLPFISRGGSSLLGFTIMLGVLLKLDSKRFQI
ncbi:MAG TPA: rod shape-determining protein RodA [Saprospiraceae bacterium]|nr:rod shape-determining protein RodA [Saprospiraceae bacterium]